MAETLTSEGYFFTGHGELPARAAGALKAKVFPNSAIYQRPEMMGAVSHGE